MTNLQNLKNKVETKEITRIDILATNSQDRKDLFNWLTSEFMKGQTNEIFYKAGKALHNLVTNSEWKSTYQCV